MIVTVTERATFKRCRRLWNYSSYNRMGMAPLLNKPALDLGTLWHQAQADWAVEPNTDLPVLFMNHAVELLNSTMQLYKEMVGAAISQLELDPLWELIHLGEAMCTNYQEFWKTPFRKGVSLVAAEQTITVPIPETEHLLEATLDGIVVDERGQFYILERKTYNSRPRIESLQMNDQFLAYLWVMRQLGYEKAVVAYDGAWKRAVPPRGSQMKDLFLRTTLVRPIDEIEEFEQLLKLEVEDMADPSVRIYKNETFDCSWNCGYRDLCAAQSRGEDYESMLAHRFTKRERTAAFNRESE